MSLLPRHPLLWAAGLVLLAGCAQQRIHDASRTSLAGGDYEAAIGQLEGGLKEHPDSALLRSTLLQARAEAQARLVTEAATLRAAGKSDEARETLLRAQALDPKNTRVAALLNELDVDVRQQKALADAEAALAKRRPEAALRTVERALKDNPRHAGLLALQRWVELDLRQAQARASQGVLAESRPISLDFRDANLRTVLDVVSRSSGVNFILDRDIRNDSRVTVFLRQAKVEDALDLIVGTNQLAKKVIDAQTVLIYPNTPEKKREYQEQIVRVFYLASAEAKGAATFLRSMLGIKEPFVDERSNMLSIRDSQENVQLAERLLALYDAGEPEVLLEVEVLEISSTRLTELGVKFPDTFSLTALPPSGSSGLTLGNVRDLGRDRVALSIGGLTVNLRREVGDFNTLANPRIRARNKEKAKVMIGDKIPVITTTTSTGGFVSDSISYLDVGLRLEVEPTVFADDEVAVKLALEVSSLGTAVRTTSGALAYQIGTRNASTLLRLADGETQLLAGLISREERSNASRVPGVGDLPVLGRLFSSQRDNGQRTELVLAITPRVLRNIRRPSANESELWVGTDASPQLRRATRGLPPDEPVEAGDKPAPVGPSSLLSPSMGLGAAPVPPGAPGLPPPAAAVPQPSRLSWGGPTEAKVGDTIELKLQLAAAGPLRGMPVDIGYDKQKLQWLGVEEGGFFRQQGAQTSFSYSNDAEAGRVRLGALRKEASGAAGQGEVATLRFKALTAGGATVRIEQATPVTLTPDTSSAVQHQPWSLTVK